jgi:glycine/D-amino acid oxidase-like deaminating enzyme
MPPLFGYFAAMDKVLRESPSFEVAIVGGGAVGAAIAYFLKAVEGFSGRVALIERDPSFARAATTLSCSSIRQQFSTPENIRLSRFGLEFLRGMKGRFGADADPALHESGYMILAPVGSEAILEENYRTQVSEGAPVVLLDRDALKKRAPWLSMDGIAAATLGLSGEGWFDSTTLLRTLRAGARAAGAELLTAEVTGIEIERDRAVAVELADGGSIGCDVLINAAGTSAGKLAALAGRPLPVGPRKRSVFVLDAPDAPRDMPLVVDPSGVWARPEGANFMAGYSPPESDDGPADPEDFEVDHQIFDEHLWPELAHRIPAFERLKVTGSWAGHYDYNSLDQNAVVGFDPMLTNFIYANGFSGHGLQQAPGVGRAVAELIVHGGYRTIDLGVFGYRRIAAGRPLVERNVI